MRQYLFDAWHLPLLKALMGSTDRRIAEIAEKASKEVAYHLERSADLVVRLGDGTKESHDRMQAALDFLWPYTGEMFLADALDEVLAASGLAPEPGSLKPAWAGACRPDPVRGDAEGAGKEFRAEGRSARRPFRASRLYPRRDAVPAARLSRRQLVRRR
jgi:hypothetical protein